MKIGPLTTSARGGGWRALVMVVALWASNLGTSAAETKPIELQGTCVWKNPLRATFTPVEGQAKTWDAVFVASYHGASSTFRGTVIADLSGGPVTGAVAYVKGPNVRTRSWRLRGKVQEGVLAATSDEVGGLKDSATIELKVVANKTTNAPAATQPLTLAGHSVFGENSDVAATLTPVAGKEHTWEAVFAAVYQNVQWTYTGTVVAEMAGGKVTGTLVKGGRGAPWQIEGTIAGGVLKCVCDDTSGKNGSATLEMKVIPRAEPKAD